MKERSKKFVFLAYLALGVAISLPLQVMLIFQIYPWELRTITSKMSDSHLALMITAVIYAICLIRVSPWVKYVSPVFILMVAVNNYLLTQHQDHGYSDPVISAASTLAVLLLHGLLLLPDAQNILDHPELRWWRTAFRKTVAVPAFVRSVTGADVQTRTHDLSETGAFISMEPAAVFNRPKVIPRGERLLQALSAQGLQNLPNPLWDKGLSVGTRCNLKINIGNGESLHFDGEVVRKAEAFGRHPTGFALRFEWTDKEQKKRLQQFLKERARIPAGMGNGVC